MEMRRERRDARLGLGRLNEVDAGWSVVGAPPVDALGV
jgi:hypothetical protein